MMYLYLQQPKSNMFKNHSRQVRHWTSPVISVSHVSLFVGLVLAWATGPPATYVKLITVSNLETLTRMTISGFHTHTHCYINLNSFGNEAPSQAPVRLMNPNSVEMDATHTHMQLLYQVDLLLQTRHQRVPKRVIGEMHTSLRPLLHISIHLERCGHWARLEVLLQPGIRWNTIYV